MFVFPCKTMLLRCTCTRDRYCLCAVFSHAVFCCFLPSLKIVYGIFLPSLLMVNVAKTCVSQSVTSLLPIPVFAGIQIAMGLAISKVAMRLLRINPNTEAGREAKVGRGARAVCW